MSIDICRMMIPMRGLFFSYQENSERLNAMSSFHLRHVWHFDALRGRWVDLDSRAVNCHRHYCKRYLPVHQTKGQTRQFKDRKKGNQPLNCSSPPTSRATASPHSSTFQWLLMMAQSNRMNINLIIVRSTSDHCSPAQYATPVPRGTIP